MRKLLLEHNRAPGDILVMSALVRDIALTYPGKFQISVQTSCKELWQHNPYITSADTTDIEHLKLGYGNAINLVGNRNRHFLLGFHEDFEAQTQIHVPLLYPRPDYHLSDDEKQIPLVSGRYWVLLAGGKSDFITKHWSYKRYQQVVNVLKSGGVHCVQVGAQGRGKKVVHFHPQLENTLCLVGQTSLRDMARLIYHSEGVIGPVTAAMHFAAAMQKPCVVVAGGREEWWWEAYIPRIGNFGSELREDVKVPHRFLHTLGKLDCCQRRGCWRNGLEPGDSQCKYPLSVGGQLLPACMHMITVNHVVEAVMSYYADGTLPPIGTPKRIVLVDGRLKVLEDNEPTPPQHQSALVEALSTADPQLLIKTDGMMTIEAHLSSK